MLPFINVIIQSLHDLFKNLIEAWWWPLLKPLFKQFLPLSCTTLSLTKILFFSLSNIGPFSEHEFLVYLNVRTKHLKLYLPTFIEGCKFIATLLCGTRSNPHCQDLFLINVHGYCSTTHLLLLGQKERQWIEF